MSDAAGIETSRSLESRPEATFRDLIFFVWGSRGWLLGGMILALLIAGTALLAQRVATYENVTDYVIEFRFEGRERNVYPNGTPFSLADIIAPAVLSEVYDAEGVAKRDMTYRDFQAAFTIAPFAPNRQAIIDTFQSIDTKRLTVAEINEAQARLQRDLDAASQKFAVLRFTTDGYSIPSDEIAKILAAVVQTWERNAIDVRGVIKIDLNQVQPNLFDASNFAALEQLSALRLMSAKMLDLQNFVQKIANQPGGELITDTKSGYNTSTLLSALKKTYLQLLELPTSWSKTSGVEDQEALGVPIVLYSSRLFDPKQAEGLDYLIAIDLFRERIGLVQSNVDRLGANEFGEMASDPETGLTIRDVGRLLSDLDDYSVKQLSAPVLSLGIAKNPEAVRLYYNARLQDLRRTKATLDSKAAVIEQANQNYQGNTSEPTNPSPSNLSGQYSTVIPQFGDAFLDRIIALSEKSGDTQFRQDLLKQKIDLQKQSTDIDAEISRIQDYIDVFGKARQPQVVQNPEMITFFTKQLDQELPAAFVKLTDYANVTRRIAYRLKYALDLSTVSNDNSAIGDHSTVGPDFFLRDVSTSKIGNLASIGQELKGYAEIANRLYEQVGQNAMGIYQKLFRPAGAPEVVGTPLVNRFQRTVLLVSALGGLLLGLLVQVLRRLLVRPSTTSAL